MMYRDSSDVDDFEGYEGAEDEQDMLPPIVAVDARENVRVAIRVRPPISREMDGGRPFHSVVRVSSDHKAITLCEHLDLDDGKGGAVYSTQTFSFDHVHDTTARQRDVYEKSAQPAVASVLQGYNATVIAYGQTGTGKTYTMEGFGQTSEERGIIPRATEAIFASIAASRAPNTRYLIRASYLQIYNEVISDLLKPLSKQLTIRHTKQRGVYVDGLSEWVVRAPEDVYELMERGRSLRATGSTRMSELSSRSHAMFILIVEMVENDSKNYKYGKLNIVDLAGSEKVRQTGVTGVRLEETKKINRSLHELGNVIAALTDPKQRERHVPFRNSCLTRALRDSLGGNCKTTLIACISPALDSYAESLSTLKFANRAKNIKNEAVVNEDADQATLLRRYEKELRRLRQTLQEREAMGGDVDASVVSRLEMSKRRAEEDRAAALSALQRTAQEVDEEKRTRRRLEDRISELEDMLGEGGTTLRSEDYMLRMDELDRERQAMEEDKAHVDRYKQLLLKQRDIMLSLTTRVNEREETILALQDEIDAYDEHIQHLEDAAETNHPPLTSRPDAQKFLQRLKVQRGPETRYRSESSDQLLTAEEKMVELLMSRGRPLPPDLVSEDRQALVALLHDRADAVATAAVVDRLIAAQRDAEAAKGRLAEAEERLRLASLTSRDGDRVRSVIEAEIATAKAGLAERLAQATRDIDAEREARRRWSKDVDRWRVEWGRLRSSIDPAKVAEVEATAAAVERAVEGLHRELLQHYAPRTPSHRDPNVAAVASGGRKDTVESLRAQVADLSAQLQRAKEEAPPPSREVAQLQRSLSTHVKDRRALKTIMESRIKTKVDAIVDLATGGDVGRLSHEARALQSLVNAAVAAMESAE